MSASRKSTTLHDVARLAGVSYQTVSRVVNRHPHVAPATRDRVLAAVERLDYRPNRAARSLKTRRTDTIGIVGFGTHQYGPAQMLSHIEQVLRARSLSITVTNIDRVDLASLERAVNDLLTYQVEGIVMIVPIRGLELDALTRLTSRTPFVTLDVERGSDLPSVVIDQAHGARLAIGHLLDLGHGRIAEIHGPLDWVDAYARQRATHRALSQTGLEPVQSAGGDWSPDSGYRAMQRILDGARGAPPTAVFVHNDQMALGAVHALRDLGLGVPEDVSVVGFDDVPEAAHYAPPLTTVRQDFATLGVESVDYLVRRMADRDAPVHQRVIKPSLQVRASTRRLDAP